MNREILEHAGHILTREATRTLSARILHERTSSALGVDFGYAHFLETLGTRPDRFTIVTERPPFGEGWSLPDADRIAAQLEHAGVLRSATVVLADPSPPDEQRSVAPDDIAAALAAMLADAHAAVVELLTLERANDAAGPDDCGAVLELDALRSACEGRLRAR